MISRRRQHAHDLSIHHDCRDPDHPGCELCEEDEEEEDDSECLDGEESDA